jgi:predicted permease
MARSVRSLASVDLGFVSEELATFRLALPDAQTRSYDERVARYRAVRDALAALPGVSAVAVGAESPLAVGARASVLVDGAGDSPVDPPDSGWQPVDPGFFGALGIPLVAGRDVSPSDDAGAPDVAVINETFARVVLRGTDPLGRRVTMGLDGHDRPLTIVGVVADTRGAGPAAPPAPVLYRPLAQTARFGASSLFFAVRRDGLGAPDAGTLRRVVRDVAPDLPLYAEASGEELALPFLRAQATLLVVLAVFAVSALGLGVVGVYGVTAQAVARRRREIGVRLALGAERGRVIAEEVTRGLRPALWGAGVGIAGAVALGRILAGLLFGVAPGDPATLAAATAIVLITVCAALYVPARRAAHIDPAQATRD